MREHRIQLRGGWRRIDPGSGAAAAGWVTLPIRWPPGPAAPVRLLRDFGAPAIDPLRERLSLRFGRVPGLLAAWLNDREIVRPPLTAPILEIELEGVLTSRNRLVLEVDPAAEDPEAAWGEIALVVRPRAEGAPSPD
jgi:hypothetical protein